LLIEVKQSGVNRIANHRKQLIESMWNMSRRGEATDGIDRWMRDTEKGLDRFNQLLYKAFKEEFVRYPDVRIELPVDKDDDDADEPTSISGLNLRRRRHRKKSKSRTTDKKEKLCVI
jgi:hypothetical protein